MRLLKDKTYNYELFHQSLQLANNNSEEGYFNQPLQAPQTDAQASSMLEKYFYLIQSLSSFEKQLNGAADIQAVSKLMKMALKRMVPLKDANIFFFDETKANLLPFDNNYENSFPKLINNVYKEGILDWVFENAKPVIIPEVNNFTVTGPKLNYIFLPVMEDGKRKALLAILSTIGKDDFNDIENRSVQLILSFTMAKIDQFTLKEKLNSTYNELQTYQAKLSNDFRLSAIGELTEGIVEDIKSPLQVILSYADFLSKDESDSKAANIVKEQVKRINFVVNRLVKFSNINEDKTNIHPCDINSVIVEYYNLIKSSLSNANVECLLDFEKDIPSVLSHPSYIFQLLSNIISIIKAKSKNGGGIILQTRHAAESIIVKIINTAQISPSEFDNRDSENTSSSLNLRIVENIMKLHEGVFKVESFQKNSSVIILQFPLRRKLRK